MYSKLIIFLRLKHGHHSTSAIVSSSEASTTMEPSTYPKPLNRADRDSCIVLGTIFFCVLLVMCLSCSLLARQRQGRDVEQRLSRYGTSASRCNQRLGQNRTSIWSRMHSTTSTLVGRDDDGKERTSWPKPKISPRAHASMTEHCNAAAATSKASRHHFSSSDRSGVAASNPPQPTPWQETCSELAAVAHSSHLSGCRALDNRRLSTLAAILEPEVALQATTSNEGSLCECGEVVDMR